jgi:uncharacterized protein involved in exopolysaccharide biosynthesis
VNSSNHEHAEGDDGFDFVDLCHVVWAQKYLVAAITAVAVGVALWLALTAIPRFRADVVVTLVEDTSMGGAQSIANQFGGLASLAGVNLNTGSAQLEHQAVLESRHLIEEFVKRNNLLPILQGPEPVQSPQPLWLAVDKFKTKVLKIDEDKIKGTTTISIGWTDPAVAARWANAFVALANELVRTKAREDSQRNVDYLNEQVAKTNVVELRRVLYNLIESETKTLMLANARIEYAFTVVDPAVVPAVRVSPKRTLIVLTGFAIGFMLGVSVVWIRNKFQRKRAAAAR